MSKSKPAKDNHDLSATGIVRLADVFLVKLFHTSAREPFASIYAKDHWENWPIRSPEFGDWLSANCFHHLGRAPSQKALADARATLSGRARYGSPEQQVHVRVAGYKGDIYLDLGNEHWETVRITEEGWDVVSHVPIKFIRGPGMLPLPRPLDGGKIADLQPFLNLGGDDHWKLAVSWLVGALRPAGPFPPLVLEGTHGSAKSTSSRILRSLIDPNTAPLRAMPNNPRDLAISAANSWSLGFDNISSIRPWLSDALCRLSTGSGFSTRALYTDSGEKIFDGMRPILLNGIEMDIERADLLDRGIFLSLLPISDEGRETEATVWTRFELVRPYILGSLLDAVSCALRRVREIKLKRPPRMADFATWICAAEPSLGWPEGSFLRAYQRNRSEANSLALEGSPLVGPIMRIADQGRWEGTATELRNVLLEELLNSPPEDQGSCPRSPKELSQAIRRLAPNLGPVGVTIRFGRTAGDNSARIISIRRCSDDATQPQEPVRA